MRSLRRAAGVAAVVLALAAPSAALAQSAGDEQYADPFGGNGGSSQPSTGSNGSGGSNGTSTSPGTSTGSSGSSGSSGSAAPATTTAPAAPAATTTSGTTAPAATTATAGQPQLPYTGAPAGLIGLAGALLLAGGVALRVRLRDKPGHD
jgi:hypothetical protein